MKDSRYRWWSLTELETEPISLAASTHLWMLQRAVRLYHLIREQPTPIMQLQPDLPASLPNLVLLDAET